MLHFKRFVKKIFYHFGLEIKFVGKKNSYYQRMFDRISEINGDIVECGVGKMGSFQILASLLRNDSRARNIWGFDSFEGFPEPTAEDTSARRPQKGEWKSTAVEDVSKFLLILGFKTQWIASRVKVVKGFFKDTIPNTDVPKIALLHLDVDLYDSYKTCLHYLFPKVVKGGVVLFDEYENGSENIKFPGAKKAIDEYFEHTNHRLLRDRHSGKYFLVKS